MNVCDVTFVFALDVVNTVVCEMENVVYDVGQSAGRCGYCDVSNDFYTHGRFSLAHRKHDNEALYDAGMLAQSSMTVNVYQDLLDLGWRRSGTYLYKVKE